VPFNSYARLNVAQVSPDYLSLRGAGLSPRGPHAKICGVPMFRVDVDRPWKQAWCMAVRTELVNTYRVRIYHMLSAVN